jgi:hypothetical protein
MRIRPFRRLFPFMALALALVAAAAACGSERPQTLEERSRAAPTPSAPPSSGTTTTTTAPEPETGPSTTGPSDCMGAVIHSVNASVGGQPWRSVCIAVGGLLRLTSLGPDGLAATSWDSIDCDYEGAVHECRLIQTGTVKLTITNTHGARPLTVTVASASSPPKPSTACTTSSPYNIDASYGGPPWRAICAKVGTVVRVQNLGPEGFTVNPRSLVSCWYEAAVRECTLVKAGTVTFTTRHTPEVELRSLIVVAIL